MSFKPISRELSSVIAEWIDAPAAREAVVLAIWPRVVGDEVAQRSRPQALEGSKLVIEVIDPAWSRALEEMAADLLRRLNGALGKQIVRSIEWRPASLSR
jgi:predicted nucleic acid-binding Zn ribbon protein